MRRGLEVVEDKLGALGAGGWIARSGCLGWDSVVINGFDRLANDPDCGQYIG